MRNRIYLAMSLILLMVASISNSWSANQQPTGLDEQNLPSYYYYHGEKVDLPLDPNRLAVRFKNGAANLTTSFPGVSILKAEPTGIEAWSLLTLSVPMQDAAEANLKIQALLNSSQIEFASPVFQGLNNTWVTMTPEILVRFQAEYQSQANALLHQLAPELEVVERNFGNLSGAYKLRSPSSNGFKVLSAANSLAQDAHIKWAEPDALFSGRGALIPNDPGFPDLWGFRNTGQFGGVLGMDMDADSAWDITVGCEGIKVLIIDTGVEQDHPDINQLPGEDFRGQGGGGGPVNECDNHGTAVAGCVSAIINNALGTVGIAPGCVILSARAFTSDIPCTGGWAGNASGTVNALTWGESQGVRVTNNSNYYGFTSSAIEDKYASTYANGMVHFAAAGNFASPFITYPSSIPVVNAVAALEMDGTLASFSNWGVGLDFSAPGVLMLSTDRTGADGYSPDDYTYFAGTSAASPYASGVAALILSQDSGLTAAQVESVMQSAARDLGTAGYDTTYGWGFVNAYNSVLAVSVADSDTDAVADPCDICPTVFNPLQENAKPGDANASSTYSLADIIAAVNYLFNKPGCSPQPLCWLSNLLCRGDWDGNGGVSLTDVIRGVNYLFNKPGGPWYALPSGVCCIPYNQ
jgi:subtilisin family serine protease